MKGLQVVYQPSGAALEYAPLACNLYTGCSHGCTYCYAPRCLHCTREEFSKPVVRPRILERLQKDMDQMVAMRPEPQWLPKRMKEIASMHYPPELEARAKRRAMDEYHERFGSTGPVLLCFTCDPFQPLEATALITRQAIKILGEAGIRTRILTKNGSLAKRDFGLMKQYGVEFGVTICFNDEHMRERWEPNAGSIAERMNALADAHSRGIKTWVSVEPVIEPKHALRAMDLCHTYVDRFAVGKLNHAKSDVDWTAFLRATLEQFSSWDCGYYIKDALWAFADEAIKGRFEKER